MAEDFERFASGADFMSATVQGWLQKLGLRQNIDLQQELTSVASGDELLIFDVSETGSVKTKKATIANIKTPIMTGTTTNDNAAAGQIGEVMTSSVASGSAVSLTTGVASDMTSLSLTAGDWDVTGVGGFLTGATTSISQCIVGTSLTSATLDGNYRVAQSFPAFVFGAGTPYALSPNVQRVSIASTTSVYFVCRATFTVSTCAVYGSITARRVR